MKIFFDTEFTGLHKNTTLISIGLVDKNDRKFYAEFIDYDKSQVDEWIRDNVIANLTLYKKYKFEYNNLSTFNNTENKSLVYGDKKYIKERLIEWLLPYDSVELVSDCCHYDMVLFIDIFGGAFDLPKNVNPVCHDINQDIAQYLQISETEAFDKSREKLVDFVDIVEGDKHNSLCDAKVIKRIYEIINE